MSKNVLIAGGGVGAYASLQLLKKFGCAVAIKTPPRKASPVLLMSGQTQRLLRDIFECDTLLSGSVQVRKRVVRWGTQESMEYPHAALVIQQDLLIERLRCKVGESTFQTGYDWTMFHSTQGEQLECGSRIASNSTVKLAACADRSACYVEAVPQGWLFLIPTGGDSGSLIAVGRAASDLLGASVLVGRQIEDITSEIGIFSAHPRMTRTLGGPSWLACGNAAIAFDPIAGEGCGHALRQAILASAVIRAADSGLCKAELLDHYSSRIMRAFGRHLNECAGYYRAVTGDWWGRELRAIEQGLEWVSSQVPYLPPEKYHLNGFELRRF